MTLPADFGQCVSRLRFVLAAVLLFVPALAGGATLDACGARKAVLTGRACADLFAARARDLGASTAPGVAAVKKWLSRGWRRAEANGGADCAAVTATASGTASRLGGEATAFASSLKGTRACRAKLLHRAGRACRRVLAHERILPAWPEGGCTGGLDPEAGGAALRHVAATARGNAGVEPLRDLGEAAGIRVGAAVDPNWLAADPAYAPTLGREFGSITPENVMKWGPIHPAPGVYDFGPADALVDFAAAHGMRVRGHNLVWGRLQLPDYVQNATSEAELRSLVTEHIGTVVGRYAGRVAEWDVVNEPLSLLGFPDANDALDDNVFLRHLGPGYVAEALELAHAADPTAKLYVNDFLVETPGPKQDRLYRLAADLLAAGAPLHGVGLQCHFGLFSATYPQRAELQATIERFAALGLEVELTELDVGVARLTTDLPARLDTQAAIYRDAVSACSAVPACRGVTTWGIVDTYSWVRSFLGIDDVPLLFGDGWVRKPAYFAARAALVTLP